MRIEVGSALSTIPAPHWNGLVGGESPFLEWEWLASLEEAGCVGAPTGWLPQHLTLWEGKQLLGACPLYLKGHSQGEFVFDHGWAEAAARAGIDYYPKLLVAVPFTPATGARFLTHPEADRPVVIRMLGKALQELCRRGGFSSAHVNFCLPEEWHILDRMGFVRRTGYQFQWFNQGWESFEEYLGAFKSKRRVQIKRERRELDDQGIEITAHAGAGIPDDLFAPMFALYKSTVDKFYWGRQYLNPLLFDLLRRRWKHRLCFFVARRDGQVIAGTFTVRKGDVLYGRYWGAFADVRYLHFNVCYYASIAYCLQHGIGRFEPGAGGEFKHLRGFDACPTQSMHFIAEPRFADAVTDYLRRERLAVEEEIAWYGSNSALKHPRSVHP